MPDYVENELAIRGSQEQLDEFVAMCSDDEELISATNFIPHPDNFSSFNDAQKNEWCESNWGTKWDLLDCEIIPYPNLLFCRFFTAWTAPIPVVVAMSNRFKELEFFLRYYESECGSVKVVGGKIVEQRNI